MTDWSFIEVPKFHIEAHNCIIENDQQHTEMSQTTHNAKTSLVRLSIPKILII